MEASAPDWSGLLPELLSKIAEMVFVDDFSAFRCVCSSWRAAAAAVKNTPTAIGSPLIMLDGGKYRKFYSPLRRKVCIGIVLPEASRKRCVPAGFGLILTAAESGEAALLNPFSRALIPLPRHEDFSRARIRPVLSDNPDYKNFVLFMLFNYQVMFWRPGDENWTTFGPGNDLGLFNIYYCGKRLYAITRDGRIWVASTAAGAKMEVLVTVDFPSMIKGVDLDKAWLMESLEENELILLVRYENFLDRLEYKNLGKYYVLVGGHLYKLFRIDVVKRKWKRVMDLDGDAVFAGDDYTGVAVPASSSSSEPSGAKPNFIYFGYNVGDIAVQYSIFSEIKPIDTYFSSHGFGSYLCLETPEALSYDGPINDAVTRATESVFRLNRHGWF